MRVAREGVDEPNDARALERREPLGGEARAASSASGPSPRGTTNAATVSPHSLRRHPDHGQPRATAGCSCEHVLDLARVDVEAAADDQLLRPPDDAQVAVGGRARRCRRCGTSRRRRTPRARRPRRRASSRRRRSARARSDLATAPRVEPQLDAGQRQADGARRAARRRRGWRRSSASRSCRSARAPAGRARLERLRAARRQRRRARHAQAQPRELAGARRRGEAVVHRRNAEEQRRLRPRARRRAPRRGRSAGAAPPRRRRAACRADPTPSPWMWNSGRQSTSRSAAVQRHARRDGLRAREQVAVGEHRALRAPVVPDV